MILAFLAATVLGILSSLGLGGGSLLLLFLTALGWAPGEARAMSLLFFFPAACLSLLRNKEKLPWRLLLPGLSLGLITAAAGALLAEQLDPSPFRKALGILLILVGLREVFHRKPPACG